MNKLIIAIPTLISLLLFFVGCTTRNVDKVWPEPRPLFKDIAPSISLQEQPNSLADSQKIKEPEGSITLDNALSLALTYNPELISSLWDVRSGKARIVQAGLFPNP